MSTLPLPSAPPLNSYFAHVSSGPKGSVDEAAAVRGRVVLGDGSD